MHEIINQIPILFIAMIINILLGIYYNIGVRESVFDIQKLIYGVIKALIIGVSFVGLAHCFDITDLSSLGVTPIFIMNSAIILYIGKALMSLGKILGINIETANKKQGK